MPFGGGLRVGVCFIQKKPERFVKKTYKGINGVNEPKNCLIKNSMYPQVNIIKYVAENNFDLFALAQVEPENLNDCLEQT